MTEEDKKAFYSSQQWRNLRNFHLSLEPTCRMCKKNGLLVLGYIVDHIEPIEEAWGKRLDDNNLQSLCFRCHNQKTFTDKTPKKKILKLATRKWKI